MTRIIIILGLLVSSVIPTGSWAAYGRNNTTEISYEECQEKISKIYRENEPLREFKKHTNTMEECQTFFIEKLINESYPGKDYRKACEMLLGGFCNQIQESATTTLVDNFQESSGFQIQNQAAAVIGAGAVMTAQNMFKKKEKVTQGTTYSGDSKECTTQKPHSNIETWQFVDGKCVVENCQEGFFKSDLLPSQCISEEHKNCIENETFPTNGNGWTWKGEQCQAICNNGYATNPDNPTQCIDIAEYNCRSRTDTPKNGTGFRWTGNICKAICISGYRPDPNNPETCITKGVSGADDIPDTIENIDENTGDMPMLDLTLLKPDFFHQRQTSLPQAQEMIKAYVYSKFGDQVKYFKCSDDYTQQWAVVAYDDYITCGINRQSMTFQFDDVTESFTNVREYHDAKGFCWAMGFEKNKAYCEHTDGSPLTEEECDILNDKLIHNTDESSAVWTEENGCFMQAVQRRRDNNVLAAEIAGTVAITAFTAGLGTPEAIAAVGMRRTAAVAAKQGGKMLVKGSGLKAAGTGIKKVFTKGGAKAAASTTTKAVTTMSKGPIAKPVLTGTIDPSTLKVITSTTTKAATSTGKKWIPETITAGGIIIPGHFAKP